VQQLFLIVTSSFLNQYIIIGMAEYAKENDDTSTDQEEYSKFGMEAMKYVEQHFIG
jgi:hypothetical protein|tara:strand:- start:440 stop:607 length:168 start_codon:yes stop_codon:yes gene_type:complete